MGRPTRNERQPSGSKGPQRLEKAEGSPFSPRSARTSLQTVSGWLATNFTPCGAFSGLSPAGPWLDVYCSEHNGPKRPDTLWAPVCGAPLTALRPRAALGNASGHTALNRFGRSYLSDAQRVRSVRHCERRRRPSEPLCRTTDKHTPQSAPRKRACGVDTDSNWGSCRILPTSRSALCLLPWELAGSRQFGQLWKEYASEPANRRQPAAGGCCTPPPIGSARVVQPGWACWTPSVGPQVPPQNLGPAPGLPLHPNGPLD